MSSWADESEAPLGSSPPGRGGYGGMDGSASPQDGPGGAPRERPRLQLKPRSTKGVVQAQTSEQRRKSSSNPFGAAKPREEVLKQKGIDPKIVDERIQKKAAPKRLSKEQEEEVEAVRAELAHAEKELREANEKELPEEKYRVLAEGKRKELNEMIENFTKLNLERDEKRALERRVSSQGKGAGGPPGRDADHAGAEGGRRQYERPSERRRRLEQERAASERGGMSHDNGGYHNEEEGGDPYSSFGGRSTYSRSRSERTGGYGGGRDGHEELPEWAH